MLVACFPTKDPSQGMSCTKRDFFLILCLSKYGLPEVKNRGHQVLKDLMDEWRAGNAGDTISVVIYSELPVVCLELLYLVILVYKRFERIMFNSQN